MEMFSVWVAKCVMYLACNFACFYAVGLDVTFEPE